MWIEGSKIVLVRGRHVAHDDDDVLVEAVDGGAARSAAEAQSVAAGPPHVFSLWSPLCRSMATTVGSAR
jgi:hypothetical protein